MARLRPTNLKCVSAVIRYKIVVNIFHYSAARVGGRSREPSPRAWSTSAWEEEGGGGSRTDRIGGGEEGVLRKEERERDCDTRRASRASTGSLSSEEERRDATTWKGVEEASRTKGGGGCFHFKDQG